MFFFFSLITWLIWFLMVMFSTIFSSLTRHYFLWSHGCLGSTHYVHDKWPHITKLDPKALKCAFLEYSRLQKGNQYYPLELNRYLILTDAIFQQWREYLLYWSEIREYCQMCWWRHSVIHWEETSISSLVLWTDSTEKDFLA